MLRYETFAVLNVAVLNVAVLHVAVLMGNLFLPTISRQIKRCTRRVTLISQVPQQLYNVLRMTYISIHQL